MTNKIMVLHAVAGLHPSSGGPSRTVTGLVDALSVQDNMEVELYTQGHKGEPWISPASANVETIRAITNNRISLGLGLPIKKALRNIPKHKIPMIVHGHGVWHPVNHWTALFARNNNIPLILHPRGMLETWSLQQKRFKKKIAMLAYQHSDLKLCSLFIATAESEYESIRRLGLKAPVAIIPNGVTLGGSEQIARESFDINSNRTRRLLFLSRIHPKKGLFMLLDAWKASRSAGWVLEIVGPNEGGYLDTVKARAAEMGLQDSIVFHGELTGQAKIDAFKRADLFVLPTFSENFGLAIAEALSYGIPVITTKGAPWRDLIDHKCGWWVDIDVNAIAKALREAMAMSDYKRSILGQNARQYVMRYNWDNIAMQMASAYEWILNKDDIPSFIHTN